MSGASAALDLDIEVAVPCAAWLDACPGAGSIAAAAARLALAEVLRERLIATAARAVIIGIRLTDDTEQRRLNRTYLGKDAPTNVLAFPLADLAAPVLSGSLLLLGDVVLAFETVQREAEAQQKLLADHLRHLVVHGVLHLLGFDHQSDDEAGVMEAREILILAALGVADPYRNTM